MLIRLDQKGMWPGSEAPNSSDADVGPPAERRDLTHTATATERGKPVVLPRLGKATRKGSRWDGGYRIGEQANAGL